MNKPIILLSCLLCFNLFAAIDVRQVTFGLGEIPATNPRVEKSGDMVTHIELFTPFVENGDGSVSTTVAETDAVMDAVSASAWLKEAHVALGLNTRSLSKRKLYIIFKEMGVWEQVQGFMEANGLWMDFSLATTLDDDDPLVVGACAALQQLLGISADQMQAILNRAVAD